MSDNKKYYYFKLKDNFFDSDSMIILESMQDGYIYSNILLKLYLKSLKNDGKLMVNDRIPFNSTMLAQVTRHNVGDIDRALSTFKELDLIEILDNGAIYMLDVQNFVGRSSTEADRKREYRDRIDREKDLLLTNSTNDGQMSGQTSDKNPPENRDKRLENRDKRLENKNNRSSTQALKDRFDSIWKVYPNKKGKDKAFKAYQKATKEGATDEEILQGINAYNAEIAFKRTEKQFIAHGSTWFNQKRWTDDYEVGMQPKQVEGVQWDGDKVQF